MFCTNKHKGSDWQGEVNNITAAGHPKNYIGRGKLFQWCGKLWSDNM